MKNNSIISSTLLFISSVVLFASAGAAVPVTNAMSTASWGYTVSGLGTLGNEVAVVFTNENATAMTWTVPETLNNVKFLVVGGGGGGGAVNGDTRTAGAGGGGGGVVTGLVASIEKGVSVTVTVGKGGAAGQMGVAVNGHYAAAVSGTDSAFGYSDKFAVTAYGGGGDDGASSATAAVGYAGQTGGSSAGSRPGCTTETQPKSKEGCVVSEDGLIICSEVFGNAGGAGADKIGPFNDYYWAAGGGGGATEAGFAATSWISWEDFDIEPAGKGIRGGDGGAGLQSDITGETLVYGSGGGGGSGGAKELLGGNGGIGAGSGKTAANSTSSTTSINALANQGGGGGGGYNDGGAGGSGIVVFRFSLTTAASDWTEKPSLSKKIFNAGTAITVFNGTCENRTVTANYTAAQIAAFNPGTYTFRATASADGVEPLVYEIDFWVLPADFSAENTIVCYGDSITYGDGAAKITIDDRGNYFDGRLKGENIKANYPYYLAGMIDTKYNVIAQAKPQQWSDTILAWVGGVDVVTRNTLTLPASGSTVWAPTNLVFTAANPYGINGGLQYVRDIQFPNDQTNYFAGAQMPALPAIETRPNPAGSASSMTGWLGDKRVRVYGKTAHPEFYDGAKTADYAPDQEWARISADGSSVEIPAGTPFTPDTALVYNDAISVIFTGTNDEMGKSTYNENKDPDIDHTTYINMIADTVTKIPSGRYVVVSTVSASHRSDEIEAAFSAKFGDNHLNLYDLMERYGLKVAVKLDIMTQTQADATTWNNEETGLMGDSVHPNEKGYQVIAYLLKQKLIELNYIEGERDTDIKFKFGEDTADSTYIWRGNSGNWSLAENWTADANGLLGYPNNGTYATAVFPDTLSDSFTCTLTENAAVKVLKFDSPNMTFIVDNAELNVTASVVTYGAYEFGSTQDGNSTIVFRGEAPSIVSTCYETRSNFGYRGEETPTGVCTVRFEVPESGWATPRLKAIGDKSKVYLYSNTKLEIDATKLGVPQNGETKTVYLASGTEDNGVYVLSHATNIVCAAGAMGSIKIQNKQLILSVVAKKQVQKPSITESFIYDGTEKVAVESSEGYVITGVSKATEVGSYEVTVALKPDYVWSDGTEDVLAVNWIIKNLEVIWAEKPSISDKIFNKGTVVTVNNGEYDGRTVTANYTAEQIAALEPGTYTFRATASAAGAVDIVHEIDFVVLPADFNADNTIVCYGDSITYGDGSSQITIDDRINYFGGRLNGKQTKAGYPYYLAGMINEKYNVINQSKPQQWSDTILAWAGGVDVVSRNDVTLPANGESVWAPTNLVFTAENQYGIDGGLQFVRDIVYPNDQTNYFAGVQMPELPAIEDYPTPSGSYSSMTGWFGDKRVRVYGETAHPEITGKSTPDYGPDQSWARVSTSGSETVIPAGTPFVPDTALLYNDAISVIFTGTNDELDKNRYNENRDPNIDHTTYIDMIAKTVSNIPSERYVVISTLSESARSDEIEAAFTEEFAEHHLNLYKMMKSCGLKVAVKLGLMTEEEAAATTWNAADGSGLMPNDDSIHPNSKGAQVVAYILKQKLIELKYIDGARDADVCFNFVAQPVIEDIEFEFDGTEKVVVATGDGYTVSGTASAVNPGVYTVTITPEDGLSWDDGTRDAITVTWKIHAERTITPMEDPSWGYIVSNLGENYDEVARVYTNENATTMTWTVPGNLADIQFLVVGGGGGGGAINNSSDTRTTGAGGGGGGVVTGIVATLEKDASITINVGKGGTAGKCAVNQYGGYGASENGGNSSLVYADKFTVTAYGGGGDGGAQDKSDDVTKGNAGKAGGSSGGSRPGCATKTAPLSTEDCVISNIDGLVVYSEIFGKAGGAGNMSNIYGFYWIAGGGGGATEAGGDGNAADDWHGGKGGEGLASRITGELKVYGSGGGGGSSVNNDGCGGIAGTGAGAGNSIAAGSGYDALANQGGGGGGSGYSANGNGGAGGSGIVVLRYKNIIQVEKPVVSYPNGSKFTVNGTEQKPVITPAEGVGYTVTYEGDFTSTGPHKVIISLKPGYVWADGSYDNIEYSYEFIERTYTKYYNSKEKDSGSYQSDKRWVQDETKVENPAGYYVAYPDSYGSHNICKYNSSAQLNDGLKPKVGKFTVSADYRVYAYSGGLKFENTTLTPVPLWENESGVSQIHGGFIELNGEGSGYFEIDRNATTEFAYVNASNNVFVLFSKTDATESKLRFGQFDGNYITNLGWFEGGTSGSTPAIEVENAVVNFYNPDAVNGVEGPLAIDVKLGDDNTTDAPVINVAGTLNINSGSTIAVDAGQKPGGMYPIITAATFNGADILLESSTVTGLADNTIGALVLSEDGKTIYLDIVYTDPRAPLPKAIEGLVYTGEELTGVEENALYILENHKAINAGEYVATAIPAPGYTWEDGSRDAQEIIWTIAKGYATWSVEPSISPTSWTEGEITSLTYSSGKVNGEDSSAVITIMKGKDVYSGSLDDPQSWSKGNYVVTFTVPGNENVAALTKSIAITVKPQAVYDPEHPNIVTTNAMEDASWGYIVNGLGSYGNEVALVFTNENASSMSWTVPQNLTDVEFLVVGGGGGGGGSSGDAAGAGGGGGAVITGVVSFKQNDLIDVKIGKGGTGGTKLTTSPYDDGTAAAGTDTGATYFKVNGVDCVKALWGGRDKGRNMVGGDGGSNAGNRGLVTTAQSFTLADRDGDINTTLVKSYTSYAHKGGVGHSGSKRPAAGGGGATEDGGAVNQTKTSGLTTYTAGKGGNGFTSSITGEEKVYGSGGGGGTTVYEDTAYSYVAGKGGSGAGDGATNGNGGNGFANLGGGGGGGAYGNGGNGGSGIVVIRYSLGDPVLGETILPITGPNGAPWGYTISGIGEFRDETAAVFTNENAKGMTWTAPVIFGENARFLVVAGGGGGGGAQSKWDGEEDTYIGGAGGGGGGVVTGLVNAASIKGKTANITVGVGGIGGKAGTRGRRITFNYVTANGSVKRNVAAYGDVRKLATDSVFKFSDNTLVKAYAGGGDGGGQINNGTVVNKGFDGGSGAGMRIGYHLAPSKGTQGSITNNDGWLINCEKFGSAGGSHGGFWYNAGGGGGATQPGFGSIDEFTGGYGGQGLASDVTGEMLVYGSGGGGATARGEGRGGVPGDGAGTGAYLYGWRYQKGDPAYGGNALANQGGGGGGGGAWSDGGNGGSGIVAIRYKNMAGGTVVPDSIRAKILDLEYTGSEQLCNLADTVGYTVSSAKGTEVGTYKVTVTPKTGYLWEDGSVGAKEFDWKIVKAQNEWITEPSISPGTWVKGATPGELTAGVAKVGNVTVTVNGQPFDELPTVEGFYEVKYTIAETESYTGLEKTVYYRVSAAELTAVDKPFVSHPDGSMFFTNGEEQKPLVVPQPIDNPPADPGYTVTYGGDFTDEGQHTITVTLKEGFKWSDETVAPLVYRYSFVDRQFVNYYWGCEGRWGSEEYRSEEAGIWFTDAERTNNVSAEYWNSFVDGWAAGEYFEPDSYDALVWATIPEGETEAILDKRGLHPKIGKLYVDGYAKVLGSSLHYINESDEAVPYVVVTEGSTLEMWINHYYSDNGGLGFVDIAKGATVYARRAIADENIFVRFDEDNADGSSLIIGNAHFYMDKEWHNAFGWFEGGTEDTKPMIRIEPSLYGTLRFTNPDAINGVAGPLTIEAAFHTKTKNMTLIDVAGDLVINPGSTLLVDAGQLDIGVYSVIDVKKTFVDDADLIRYGSVTNLKKGTYGTLVKSDDGKSINLHVTAGPIVNNKTVKPEDVYNTARISKPIYYPCNAHMFDEDNGDRVIRWGSTNVVVPVYYDPSFVGGAKTQIGVVFNEKATPKIVAERDDEGNVTADGIVIGDDGKVTVRFENTHRQLFYSLRTATSLDGVRSADTVRDGLVEWVILKDESGNDYVTVSSDAPVAKTFAAPAAAAPAADGDEEPDELRLFTIQVFDETEAID